MFILRVGLVMLVLSGCFALPKPSSQPPPTPKTAGQSNPLLYHVLAAELASHQKNLPVAITHYKQLLAKTDELPIIRRATRVMLFAKDYAAANQAVKLWLIQQPQSIEAHRLAAQINLGRIDLAKAADHLDWLLTHIPPTKSAHLINSLLNNPDAHPVALDTMEMVLNRRPHSLMRNLLYARLAFDLGQFEQTQKLLTPIIKKHPDNIPAQVLLAQATDELKQTDLALAGLKASLEQNDHDELRLVYARLLVKANRYEQAALEFASLLDKAGENVNGDLLYSVALLNMQIRQFDQAKNYLHRLLKIDNYQQEARYYLGRLHEQLKQFATALDWLEQVGGQALSLNAQMSIARIQGKLGNINHARDLYRSLRATYTKDSPSLWVSEGEMLRETKQYQLAFAVLNQAVEAFPDNLDVRYSRALVAERLDNLVLLESDLRLIINQDSDHAHALNALGYTLAEKTKRLDEAYGYIQRALQLEPNDAAIMDSMGWVQYRLGDYDQALYYLRKANQYAQDGEIAAHLGEVLWVSGEQQQAKTIWQDALRRYPDNELLKRTIDRFNPGF